MRRVSLAGVILARMDQGEQREDLGEELTRLERIDPALEAAGWARYEIAREFWTGRVDSDGWWEAGRADYVLQLDIDGRLRPVAVVEAKAAAKRPEAGAEQAAAYARSIRVPFAFCTNGVEFIEVDIDSGAWQSRKRIADFPSPYEIIKRHPKLRIAGDKQDGPAYGGAGVEREFSVRRASEPAAAEADELFAASRADELLYVGRAVEALAASREDEGRAGEPSYLGYVGEAPETIASAAGESPASWADEGQAVDPARLGRTVESLATNQANQADDLAPDDFADDPPLWGGVEADRCGYCGKSVSDDELFCLSCDGLIADPSGGWIAASRGARLISYVLEYILFALLLGVGWFIWASKTGEAGQTPAKKLFGLYVRAYRAKSRKEYEAQLMGREIAWRLLLMIAAILLNVFAHPLLQFVPFIVDGMWIFGSSRRTLHDYVSDTVVIARRGGAS